MKLKQIQSKSLDYKERASILQQLEEMVTEPLNSKIVKL